MRSVAVLGHSNGLCLESSRLFLPLECPPSRCAPDWESGVRWMGEETFNIESLSCDAGGASGAVA